ncbi:NAD(P)H-hydrate dehydratase [Antarctobacter heliothermus]|uniref:Bifunctional NAD(P)H-hydrate repair enzyme n=1 Tax=Antarctobacter heliothermus TaxID=74033 RepID=A0A239H8E8_9RHOB|nr:NAD(P)H-hydrate dehydratase [Antarctobacter heliothermus]SNS77415.1 yjeF C-terminal region, hydroxyethylthiazole kinase-related/yjeF N-terminal region [Antarctobacter heliothermus]
MTELLTSEQMRAVEQSAINSGRITGLELMECAGRGVVDAILLKWPELACRGDSDPDPHDGLGQSTPKALILCGPGNNGGDGFVVARLLMERRWDVAVWTLAVPTKASPDALTAYSAWVASGGVQQDWAQIQDQAAPDLVVDALFGTGLTRPVPTVVADVFRHLRDVWGTAALRDNRRLRRVAVDMPSGVSSDTGDILRPSQDPHLTLPEDQPGIMDWAFQADLTVSFHTAKLGHYLESGPSLSGRLVRVPLPKVQDCDSPADRPVSVEGHVRLVEPVVFGRPVAPVLHFRALQKASGHKFDHGHALILSGPPGQGGAARMAARAALRIGAGLVTVGCPRRGVPEHASHLNAIMVRGLDGTHGLAELLEDPRYSAVCLGPGLGLGPSTGELVKAALLARRGTVLDADALSRFQRTPEGLFDMLHDSCVLTPHAGEFSRLFPDLADRLQASATTGPQYSKVDATRAAAARAGCVVLFKGPVTVIAAPDGQCSLNAAVYERATPWLATAGAGDVLAGMITGLLARGHAPMRAAEAGAWLHVETARVFGPGLIAEDLPETLPRVFRELGL